MSFRYGLIWIELMEDGMAFRVALFRHKSGRFELSTHTNCINVGAYLNLLVSQTAGPVYLVASFRSGTEKLLIHFLLLLISLRPVCFENSCLLVFSIWS